MEKLELVLPTQADADAIWAYRQAFIDNAEALHGCAGLDDSTSAAQWLEMLENARTNTNLPQGFVPATTFLCKRAADGQLVGIINIRHELNDFLFMHGGHIGYSVRKSERRKGYAKEMLRLALAFCRERNMERVLITCDRNNEASARTILANGGVFENEVLNGEGFTRRYWISLW